MKLTILTENVAGGKFMAEHGISYLIETKSEKILFDTGHSDIFLKNAQKAGINIDSDVDKIVLSHGHWDHGDGLQHVENKTLITHPASFNLRYRKSDHGFVGLKMQKEDLQTKFRVIETTTPYLVAENIWFLGEIPRINDFEARNTPYIDCNGNDDFIPDDSALCTIVNNELIVITGCSHSGICNIIEYAMKVTGITNINTVLGGFHLKYNNLQTQKTIEFFKRIGVKSVLASHCTELPALALFHATFNSYQLKTGMTLNF